MRARLLKFNYGTKLLFSDGTIKNATLSAIKDFFLNYDREEHLTGTDGRWSDTYLDMSEHPGENLAFLSDSGQLIICDPDVLRKSFDTHLADESVNKYLTTAEYAQKHNCSVEIVKHFLRDKRIPGAFIHGRTHFIPENAPYPVDEISRKPTSGKRKL